MVLVRKALALYEADEAKKAGETEPTAPPKKRRGRPPKAEKAKVEDSHDLRNASSYEGMKEENGGNA